MSDLSKRMMDNVIVAEEMRGDVAKGLRISARSLKTFSEVGSQRTDSSGPKVILRTVMCNRPL
jgi:hypothetical protein